VERSEFKSLGTLRNRGDGGGKTGKTLIPGKQIGRLGENSPSRTTEKRLGGNGEKVQQTHKSARLRLAINSRRETLLYLDALEKPLGPP